MDHVAIAAVRPSHDLTTEEGLGVARFVRVAGEPEVAEAAVTVADDAQGNGVGRHLLTELARLARERGVRRFRAEVHASNEPMRAILRGVTARVVERDAHTIVFDVPLDDAGVEEPGPMAALRAAARSMASSVKRVL